MSYPTSDGLFYVAGSACHHALGAAGLLAENVELLEGVVVAKMLRSPLRVFYTQELASALNKVVNLGYHVREEKPLTFRDSEPEPDVALVRGGRTDFLSMHPTTAELVIEVAISSSEIDHQKRRVYAAAGVLENWILLPEGRSLQAYTGPLEHDYAVRRKFTAMQVVNSEIFPAFQLNLAEFFAAADEKSAS